MAKMVKAVDEVQKNNAKLGTVVVGVGGVEAADFEKLQTTHKLTTPLTVAEDKDGPSKYKLNKDAAVTVLVYKTGRLGEQDLRVQGHQGRRREGQGHCQRRRGSGQVTASAHCRTPRPERFRVGLFREEPINATGSGNRPRQRSCYRCRPSGRTS